MLDYPIFAIKDILHLMFFHNRFVHISLECTKALWVVEMEDIGIVTARF
jgi:hypothetical protein